MRRLTIAGIKLTAAFSDIGCEKYLGSERFELADQVIT